MKAFIISVVLMAFLLIGCKQNGNVSNLEGTYISRTKGEYAINDDTLIVTSLNSEARSYSISSKTGFQKIRNGKTLGKEYKEDSWSAIWDENKEVLTESEFGRKIQFRPSDETLIWNKLVFKKSK